MHLRARASGIGRVHGITEVPAASFRPSPAEVIPSTHSAVPFAALPRVRTTPYGKHMSRFKGRISSLVMLGCLSLGATTASAQQVPLVCDADNNGVIDSRDITLIGAARNTAATGPTDPRDPNRDGIVNVLDGRFCATLCTLANCAKAPAIPAPIASAGADQQVAVGATVELNGSASTSARGDSLSYKWSLVSLPTGSTALLANPTSVRPTFLADQQGLYEAELQVTDAHAVVSLEAAVLIGVGSPVPPVANPGKYPTATPGGQVTLDASQSTDVGGAQLIDTWKFILVPTNSAATLSSVSALSPTFTTDLPGQYYLQLSVLDSNFNTTAANTVIDTQPRTAVPTANPGPPQSVPRGHTVVLDGSQSSAPAGASITYQWVLLAKPAGSTAQLANPSLPQPSLVIDVVGDYVAQLIVIANGLASQPATVLISTNDVPPIANAGASKAVFVGDTAFLQGTGTAPDGNPLTYRWSLIDTPLGFNPVPLIGANTTTPNFVPTNPGPYVAQLVVNNGHIDSAPSTTVVQASTPTTADLSIAQTVSTSTPNVGDTVQLTIIVNNLGRLNATTATVSDVLPAGLQLTGAIATQGSYNSATGIWAVGTLGNGRVATLSLTAKTTAVGTLVNTATITASTPNDPNAANNVATATLIVAAAADLSIAQTTSTATPVVGANFQLTITVSNLGPLGVTSATVSDLLPAGLQFVSATPSQGTYIASTGIWTVGALAKGTTAQLSLTVAGTTVGSVANTASITASVPNDPVATNNVASVSLAVQASAAADLSITQTASTTTPVVGANLKFTVTVNNLGPLAATSATVSDVLPAGLQLVSSSPSQGTYSSSTGAWTVGPVANGASAQLSLTATATTTGSLVNTATLASSAPNDPVAANNVASITISPQQAANLTIVTHVSNSTPVVGSNVVFTTTVTNGGPAAASGAQVADLLPSGFAVVSAQASSGSYSASSGVWSIGTLANGASSTLAITATVLATGSYTDTATVNASNSLNTGAGITSTVAITPVSPPSVQVTGPAAGTTLIAPASVSLSISASSPSGVIAQLAIFDGATLVQTVPVNLPAVNFGFTLSGVAAGTHSYTAVATDGQGLKGTSNVATVVVVAPTAVGAMLAPVNHSFYVAPATVTLIASASSSSASLNKVEFFQGSLSLGVVTSAPYQLAVTGLAVGTYSFTVAVTDSTSTVVSAPAVVTVIAAPTVAVRGPASGATLSDNVVNISGSVQAPPNSAIDANGIIGTIANDGAFFVNKVPLTVGSNTVVVTVTTPDAQSASQQLVLSSTGPGPVAVDINPSTGLGPLTVNFSVADTSNAAISRVDVSCSNNGNVDISATSVNTSGASLSVGTCTYPSPGSYQTLVNVIGGSGQIIYSTTQSIYVVAPADQELMVRAVYVGMLGRLTAGDITGALNAMTAGVYAKYSAVFTSLSNLPSVVSQLGIMQQATVTNDVAEYLIVQNTPTGPASFLVYLIRGEDGIWRIDGM
jgi:uncharacterized repeat protein (TIGR01451 family)